MAGTVVKCTFGFQAEGDTDLTLLIGDLVKITKVINEDWYEGTLNGKTGQFPKAFVEACHDIFDIGIATSTFNAEHDGDLSIKEGELVVVTELVDEHWMKGYIQGGKHGMFPRNFIKQVSLDVSNTLASNNQVDEKIMAEVLYNFTANDSNELNLTVGAMIEIIDDSDDFWCEGRTLDGQQGVFPRDFVNLPAKSKELVESAEIETHSATQAEENNRQDEVAAESETYIGTVVATFDFSSAVEGDLSFKTGDEIQLIENIDGAWCRGKLGNEVGMFPAGYVNMDDIDNQTNNVISKQPEIYATEVSIVTPAEEIIKPAKKKPPGRPKLPTSKDFVPFCYQFNTKSQPTVIIPPAKLKPGQQNILVLKKRTESNQQTLTSQETRSSSSTPAPTSNEGIHDTYNNIASNTSYGNTSGNNNFETNTHSHAEQFNPTKFDTYSSSARTGFESNAQNYSEKFDQNKYESYGNNAKTEFNANSQGYSEKAKGYQSTASEKAKGYQSTAKEKYDTQGYSDKAKGYQSTASEKAKGYQSTAKEKYDTQGYSEKAKGYQSTAKQEYNNLSKNIPNENMSTYQRMKCANNNLNTAVTVANAVGIKTTKTEIAKGAIKMGAGAYVVGSQPAKGGKPSASMNSAAIKGLGSKFGSKK